MLSGWSDSYQILPCAAECAAERAILVSVGREVEDATGFRRPGPVEPARHGAREVAIGDQTVVRNFGQLVPGERVPGDVGGERGQPRQYGLEGHLFEVRRHGRGAILQAHRPVAFLVGCLDRGDPVAFVDGFTMVRHIRRLGCRAGEILDEADAAAANVGAVRVQAGPDAEVDVLVFGGLGDLGRHLDLFGGAVNGRIGSVGHDVDRLIGIDGVPALDFVCARHRT